MNENTLRLTIRDMPKRIIDILDEAYISEGYSSRNALIVEVLSKYAMVQDKIYANSLPVVVKAMCNEELDKLQEVSLSCVGTISTVSLRLLKATQKLEAFLEEDNNDVEYEELDKIIAQLHSEMKDNHLLDSEQNNE